MSFLTMSDIISYEQDTAPSLVARAGMGELGKNPFKKIKKKLKKVVKKIHKVSPLHRMMPHNVHKRHIGLLKKLVGKVKAKKKTKSKSSPGTTDGTDAVSPEVMALPHYDANSDEYKWPGGKDGDVSPEGILYGEKLSNISLVGPTDQPIDPTIPQPPPTGYYPPAAGSAYPPPSSYYPPSDGGGGGGGYYQPSAMPPSAYYPPSSPPPPMPGTPGYPSMPPSAYYPDEEGGEEEPGYDASEEQDGQGPGQQIMNPMMNQGPDMEADGDAYDEEFDDDGMQGIGFDFGVVGKATSAATKLQAQDSTSKSLASIVTAAGGALANVASSVMQGKANIQAAKVSSGPSPQAVQIPYTAAPYAQQPSSSDMPVWVPWALGALGLFIVSTFIRK